TRRPLTRFSNAYPKRRYTGIIRRCGGSYSSENPRSAACARLCTRSRSTLAAAKWLRACSCQAMGFSPVSSNSSRHRSRSDLLSLLTLVPHSPSLLRLRTCHSAASGRRDLSKESNAYATEIQRSFWRQHGKEKALTVLAHKLARAVYFMLR